MCLFDRRWRFVVVVVVDIGVEWFIHPIDVDVFHYASFASLPAEVTAVVQFLRDLPLRMRVASVKVKRTGRIQAGAGKRPEPKLGKSRVHLGQT